MTPVHLIRARWVAPLQGDLLPNGAVAIQAVRILDLGNVPSLPRRGPQSTCEDAGEVVLLPGLINPHCHLELSDCTPGQEPEGGLEEWLGRMLTRARIEPAELEARSAAATRQGVEQCLRYGVTMVGDISRQCHITRTLLNSGPLRVISFGEVMAMAQRRNLLESRLAAVTQAVASTPWLRIGISPPAPYSIEQEGYRRCLQLARERSLPLATHLAEARSEAEFLAEQRGPLRDLWEAWLSWDQQVPRFAGGPIRMAQSLGLLDYPTVLAHVNYCDDAELALLAAGQASVVYCPRTHAFFHHPPHRFRAMLQAGINVAIGTDSCASSPNLNLVDDLRLVHRLVPQLPPEQLWLMATLHSARALQVQADAGTIAPGKWADLVAFPVQSRQPLLEVLENPTLACAVWIDGRMRVNFADRGAQSGWQNQSA